MITIENITIYKCSFCKKKYEKQHACLHHEKYCTKNPENHSICAGCRYLEEKKETIEHDENSYLASREQKYFFCGKHQQRMHPLKAERTGIVEKYPEQFEESILFPKVCEDFYI